MAAAVFLRGSNATRYDQALPFLMQHYYGYAFLGLGISAILASLMSGLAGNINAFSTLWTHDLYRAYIKPNEDDSHYLYVGRVFTFLAACLSVATAYIAFRFNNLMDYLQLLFSLFNAPLFATFLLGMFSTWATPSAGFCGLLCGVLVAGAHNFAVRFGAITYGSQMLANFYGAIFGWTACIATTIIVSQFTEARTKEELRDITYFTQSGARRCISPLSWGLAIAVLTACATSNFIFR
jgi:SSS family solute:Na+ symporter